MPEGYLDVQPSPKNSNLTAIADEMFGLMVRNVATAGVVYADPAAPAPPAPAPPAPAPSRARALPAPPRAPSRAQALPAANISTTCPTGLLGLGVHLRITATM
jgi:hypothetical protein